jgi:hypothetical protein
MNDINCNCKTYKQKKYIKSPDDLRKFLKLTKELVENGNFKLTADLGDNSDYYQKEFACTDCGEEFLLECEAYHGSGGSFGKKSKITSEHIIKIDYLCQSKRIEETYRGKDIYDESKKGEWVYFDCYFDELTIREKFNLPATVKYYEYDGKSAGQESGFIDELTNDAVLGNHPFYAQKRNRKKIE